MSILEGVVVVVWITGIIFLEQCRRDGKRLGVDVGPAWESYVWLPLVLVLTALQMLIPLVCVIEGMVTRPEPQGG